MHPLRSSPLLLIAPLLFNACNTSVSMGLDIDSPGPPQTIQTDLVFERHTARHTARHPDRTVVSDRVSAVVTGETVPAAVRRVDSVWLNDVVVPRSRYPGTDWNWLWGAEGTLALSFDGRYHRVRVAGSGPVPSFIDSVQAPRATMRTTFPEVGDTVSRSKGFVIQWEPPGTVEPNTWVLCEMFDSPQTGLNGGWTGDSGSFQVTPYLMALSTLDTGSLEIVVTRTTSHARSSDDGR